jgi:hypothetical protein
MDNQEDKASLEGKGWDILAGGKDHASETGGDDPFDAGSSASAEASAENPFAEGSGSSSASAPNPFDEPVGSSMVAGGENPFDDDPTGEVMDSGHGSTEAENVPPEAYGDWGRGGERPDPMPTPGATGEPEPRDIKPEELGYQPGREPESMPTTPRPSTYSDEDVLPSGGEAPPGRLVPPSPELTGVGTPLSDGVEVSASPDHPLSETMEVAKPSRFASPPKAAGLEAPFHVFDPFEPTGEPPVYTQPGEELPLDPGLGPQLVTPERVNALWDEINETYEAAIADVRGHFQSTDKILSELKRARELLLSGLENFDNAEVIVKRVKARLELEQKVRGWSRTVGTWIAVYLVAWLGTLVLLVMIQAPVVDTFAQLMPRDMAAAYIPALWGALGGVLGGLWVLIEHTARKRDFDPMHTRWYVLNPFMGMGLGVVMYALFQMGVIVGGVGTGQPAQTADLTQATPWLLYGFCLVVGFQQNVLWDLLDRLLDVLRGGERKEEAAANESAETIVDFD